MGYGDYSHEAHVAFTQARTGQPRETVFKQSRVHPMMDPKGIRARESRDSADHPHAIAIAFALDVTGSMGQIPHQLATETLPGFMAALGAAGVKDPQLLFMAVGDAWCDRSPVQIGQFESTAELMDQWLTWTHIEGGGGGQNTESYELGMYLLAEHTAIDCWEKRKRRGYAFFTGDELPYPVVSKHQVEALIGDQLEGDVPVEAVVAALQQTWNPFFLIPDPGREKRCGARWRELLGHHVITMETPADTCHVAAGLVALGERSVSDLDSLARLFEHSGLDRVVLGRVVRALSPFAASAGMLPPPPLKRPPESGALGWLKSLLG